MVAKKRWFNRYSSVYTHRIGYRVTFDVIFLTYDVIHLTIRKKRKNYLTFHLSLSEYFHASWSTQYYPPVGVVKCVKLRQFSNYQAT